MDKYDAVVIGAGNGGLTCAVSLAQMGLNTLLLERHNIPGGCATSFCRGRFEFEVALHQLSGMGTEERPGGLRRMLGSLGVMDDLEFVEMKDLYRAVKPGELDVTIPADRSEAISGLQKQFPHESEGIERFFNLMYRFAGEMLGAFILKDPVINRDKYPTIYSYAFKTFKEVLDDHFSDPLLKAAMSVYWGYIGVAPNRLSFPLVALMFVDYMENKPHHIKGGSQALSTALSDKFLSLGGTARFNCGAKKILVENNAVKGVETEHGERIETDYVVSNVSAVTTYVDLIGPENAPGEVFKDLGSRTLSTSAFTLFIGLDCRPEAVGIRESTSFILTHTDIDELPHRQMHQLEMGEELLVLSCYDVADPSFSPEGASQVALVTLKYAEPWLRVPPSEYAKVKYQCADAVLTTVEKAFPGLRGYIEEIETATPLTHMRYLSSPAGAVYAYDRFMKDTLFLQPSPRAPVKGLYFAGGWAGLNGFHPTLESGGKAARAIKKAFDKKGGA